MKWAHHDSDTGLRVHSVVGASLLNGYKVNLTGKETSAVLQRQFCKLSGCGISGMFAQEETADVNFALFVSQGHMPLARTDTRRGKNGFRRERLKNRSAGQPRFHFLPPPICHISGKVNPMPSNSFWLSKSYGTHSVRKVIPALTGLARLGNLITLARENTKEGNGQEAREGIINGKFL